MEILNFIKNELLDSKGRLDARLKEIPEGKRKPIRDRIQKLTKAIESIDHISVIEKVFFKEQRLKDEKI